MGLFSFLYCRLHVIFSHSNRPAVKFQIPSCFLSHRFGPSNFVQLDVTHELDIVRLKAVPRRGTETEFWDDL